MKKKIITIFLVLCLTIISIGMAGAHEDKNVYVYYEEKEQSTVNDFTGHDMKDLNQLVIVITMETMNYL